MEGSESTKLRLSDVLIDRCWTTKSGAYGKVMRQGKRSDRAARKETAEHRQLRRCGARL